MREEPEPEENNETTEDSTNVGNTAKNSKILTFVLQSLILYADLMDVSALASEDEGKTHSVDEGSYNC